VIQLCRRTQLQIYTPIDIYLVTRESVLSVRGGQRPRNPVGAPGHPPFLDSRRHGNDEEVASGLTPSQ
jgi:hypothetical protein